MPSRASGQARTAHAPYRKADSVLPIDNDSALPNTRFRRKEGGSPMRTPKSRPEAVENLVLSLGLVALLVCGLARWAGAA